MSIYIYICRVSIEIAISTTTYTLNFDNLNDNLLDSSLIMNSAKLQPCLKLFGHPKRYVKHYRLINYNPLEVTEMIKLEIQLLKGL